MTRLIDADELKQAEERIANLPWGDWQGHKVGFTWMPHEVQRLIDRSPTIDAVEVVRCGRCEWWKCNPNTEEYGVCKKVSYDDFAVVMDSDDFCSYGERREESEVEV